MSPTQAAAAQRRYRARNAAASSFAGVPTDNLLWRTHKVPLHRADAVVQLDLLGPDGHVPAPPDGMPNPKQFALERVDRAIRETLAGMRPQLNRMVREIDVHLESHVTQRPDSQLVEQILARIEHLAQRYVDDALAFREWSEPGASA